MEDSSEDLPKVPQRATARPFFAPRPSSGEGKSAPLNLGRRSSALLFTPPGSAPATVRSDKPAKGDAAPVATPLSAPVTSAADESTNIDFEGDWAPSPMIHSERALEIGSSQARHTESGDDHLEVEQYEPKIIELTAAAPDLEGEHSIEVIEYDDANSLLKAAAIDGKDPEVDGLRLESTEFSFERETPPPGRAYGSWVTETFSKQEERRISGARPAEQMSLEELKQSEPWDLTPSHGLESIPDDLHEDAPSAQPADSAQATEEASVHDPVTARQDMADALVRLAARVRDGSLEVQRVTEMSDASVLSAVLTALLRTPVE